ncbi:MAG: CBS domain-containing protein [Candidatus Poribacteria bacterium]|nr:CBS domain-containing protein [Candidatus Poribacteria bacterium]
MVNALQEDLDRFEEELDIDGERLPDLELDAPIGSLSMRNHATLEVTATIGDAVRTMLAYRVGCLPVVDDNVLVGIVTERDVLLKIAPNFQQHQQKSVRELMVADCVSIHANESIAQAIELMHDGHYRHLPVVDDDHHVKAVISVRNIMEHLIDHFPVEVLNLPPTPFERKPMETPEGA